ncbi:MAG: glycosyltransferase [Synechococcales bacterium]|nr:glycosyltransferase [Synechococcales bacterium]
MTMLHPAQPILPTASPDASQVTIIVSPRERFSYTRESLESIYAHTSLPFHLIYLDGGSPAPVRQYLETQAAQRGFQLIRTDYYLAPNQARNLGLSHVTTPYVLFIDNDVEVTPGWCDRLLECAEDTGATVVCPLTCIGKPLHQKIHLAGGEARLVLEIQGNQSRYKVHEKHYFVNRPIAEVADQLQRRQCEFAEFHCMLVRTDIFQTTGLLDEKLRSTREHIDFCLNVTRAGGTIFCEPASVVTYVPEVLYRWSDLSYFMLRWSDEWEEKSLKHFRKKWNLDKDKYFKKRYRRMGHRRHQAFLRPLIRRLTFGKPIPWVEQGAIALERRFNRWFTATYQRRTAHLPRLAPALPPLAATSEVTAASQPKSHATR